METKIFYFSTTGNSLALARELAKGLGGAELVPIPKALGQTAHEHAERIGFVFPVYGWGVPRIVAEFLKGFQAEGKSYIFAIATCGGTPARTLKELRKLLRKNGADLDAGFICREGSNTVTDDPGFVRFVKSLNRFYYPSGKERLAEIIQTIQANKKHAPETGSTVTNLFCGMMHGLMGLMKDKLMAWDNAYSVDENCRRCGTCEKICPRGNVRLESGKPVWHHNCEMCYGCIQWCPQHAIHVANETYRYHNPEIKAADLALR